MSNRLLDKMEIEHRYTVGAGHSFVVYKLEKEGIISIIEKYDDGSKLIKRIK